MFVYGFDLFPVSATSLHRIHAVCRVLRVEADGVMIHAVNLPPFYRLLMVFHVMYALLRIATISSCLRAAFVHGSIMNARCFRRASPSFLLFFVAYFSDFTAWYRVVETLPGIGFYNSADAAGASQRHKHMQVWKS